jgi:hypothetical protein
LIWNDLSSSGGSLCKLSISERSFDDLLQVFYARQLLLCGEPAARDLPDRWTRQSVDDFVASNEANQPRTGKKPGVLGILRYHPPLSERALGDSGAIFSVDEALREQIEEFSPSIPGL